MNYVSPKTDFTSLSVMEDEVWYLVLIAVLFALGATIVLGAAAWCVFHNHGNFTGGVGVKKWQLYISIECSK